MRHLYKVSSVDVKPQEVRAPCHQLLLGGGEVRQPGLREPLSRALAVHPFSHRGRVLPSTVRYTFAELQCILLYTAYLYIGCANQPSMKSMLRSLAARSELLSGSRGSAQFTLSVIPTCAVDHTVQLPVSLFTCPPCSGLNSRSYSL